MYRETHARSVVKAISWRILGTIATSVLVFALTGRLALSLAIGGLEFASKFVLFWLHERLWDRLRFGRHELRPLVVWFTGLSGSGKTAVSRWVADRLRARGLRVEHLDGETIRDLFPETGFTRPDRNTHIKRIGLLASKLEQNGVFVIASFVSPYEESRRFVRGLCSNFVEVHVATPLEICEQRDRKGLYARARRGEIRHFTGIDDPYELPRNPDLRVDTSALTVGEAGERVLALIRHRVARGSAARATRRPASHFDLAGAVARRERRV